MNFFGIIGEKIDKVINWLFNFRNDNIHMLLWGGLISATLVFIIEYLRKPKIKISFLNCGFKFKLPHCVNSEIEFPEEINSENWKFEVKYKDSWLNHILFRYPINNLKAKVSIYDNKLQKIREFQAKPDTNSNIYKERDIPTALLGINLTKGESDKFPFINKSSTGCGKNNCWLPFEVWQIFLDCNREYLDYGIYFIKVSIVSDQANSKSWAKFILSERDILTFQELNFIERIKLKFYK
jgi:hypothetical protein